MTSTSATTPPNALFIQMEETAKLQRQLDHINNSYYHMSTMRNRTNIRHHEEFVSRQKDLFIESIHVTADLKRSKAKEALIAREQQSVAVGDA